MRYQTIPSHPAYKAGEDGTIIGRRGKALRPFPGTGGYLRFTTFDQGKWQQVSVHVMVCEAFHGPKPTPEHHAAHKNGNLIDNRAENLRWATIEENAKDRRLHGRDLSGERHHQAKLTEAQVIEIRRRRSAGERGSDLAREFGVTDSQIASIHKRKSWTYLP